MKKYLKITIIITSGLCASNLAFAAEPASSSMLLSDQQMDSVTAGGDSDIFGIDSDIFSIPPSWLEPGIHRETGDTTNVSYSPTTKVNINDTPGSQTQQTVVGAQTTQTGGVQTDIIPH
jgi:hypothetical protein